MKTPTISVIMPVYNAEKYISETIESILNQTYSDFELLILDDHSSDTSLAIIQSFQERDPRIVVVSKLKNVGPANLRNEGFKLANAPFIALMDADDIALPTRFEKQILVLTNNLEIGVCGTWFTFFGGKKNRVIRHEEQPEAIKVSFLHSCGIGNPTVMLRKSCLQGLQFDPEYVPVEDYELWSRLLSKTKFYNIQESLLRYRQHENNISKTKIQNVNGAVLQVKKNQMMQFGIAASDEKMTYYLNAVSLRRKLCSDEIVQTISASKFLLSQNTILKNFDEALLQIHINNTLIRTIRNAKNQNLTFYNYLKNEENELFKKINRTDKAIFLVKSLF